MKLKSQIIVFALAVFLVSMPLAASAQGAFCEGEVVSVPCFFDTGLAGTDSFGDLVLAVIQILLMVVGSLSVLFLIIGGSRYVTAAGNEENAESAKKTMTHAIIGLVIVILSFAIITIITNILLGGSSGI